MRKLKKPTNTIGQWLQKQRDQLLTVLVEWTKTLYIRWFKQQQSVWQHNRNSLKKFPKGSLGHDLACFLESEGFELMPKVEEHDAMHVLMNYKTTVIDEARMQFFLLGNGKRSLYALATAAIACCLIPEGWRAFRKEFRLGRQCRKIVHWELEHLLAEPTLLLRQLVMNKDKDVGVEAPFYF